MQTSRLSWASDMAEQGGPADQKAEQGPADQKALLQGLVKQYGLHLSTAGLATCLQEMKIAGQHSTTVEALFQHVAHVITPKHVHMYVLIILSD
eukprot:g60208.t1